MSTSAAQRSQDAQATARSPLAQLLHALNQPLTGLQCSMEVALSVPRSPEQYVRGLREGLELTDRMRALVEAIREVADGEEETKDGTATELKSVLGEVVEGLQPVAGAKSVGITLECAAGCSPAVKLGRQRLSSLLFRSVESALGLADRGSALRIEMVDVAGAAADDACIRIRWYAGTRRIELSRPELGLLVAQAGWERAGAKWKCERTENLETVTIRLGGVSASRDLPQR